MTMCSSGSIGIISCPQGAGSSLAFEVCGSVASPPYSLSGLSTAAGISLSSGMTGFYGYSASATPLNLCCQQCSNSLGVYRCSACLCGVISAGDCASICTCYSVETLAGKTSAIACIVCNTTTILGCSIGSDITDTGIFNFEMCQNDSVIFCVYAKDISVEPSWAYSDLCVLGISGIVGSYSAGTCTNIWVGRGGI